MNTSVIRFKASPKTGYQYLLIFLKSNLFKVQIDLLITGGAQPNFGPAHLNKIKIITPKSFTDQKRIATILSNMDAGLEALEQQLHKARQIKQDMMQELLTGKVRLI
ncbi:restriction endonuclease subunit S [Chryseobacterium sp. cx-311]|uniref:restriction endonuclease subunit S n=1 Tax=Marnyiella aurantia TaxID=2758037 RepID=UPI001AE2701B|nr:restriction endonuclease subunit S [Marnyiella aurantia]MBP0613676.1 restriction endonuclease subunit S [Marnyiella aurantia]